MRQARLPGGRRPLVSAGAVPPLPPARFVDRPRLRETLAGAVPLGLAVLVAPGGFGKSVALADFARRAPFPVAWVGLSAAECDIVAFVEALAGAVGRHVPGFGRQSVKVARQSGPNTVLALADHLAGELADHGAPIAIVLDDLHKVDGAADVGKLVAELVERRPSNCFFAIASRTLPNLPYARLIALGRMAGIPADELRFTREEAAQFLERPPEDEEVERVLDATGGWAAALALGTGSFPAVLDEYLEHEVFLQQPPPAQAFLLRASVPPTLDEDVCRRLLEAPEGPQLLNRAHRAGLFVSALPNGGWRLHDLFRDFLRARLRQTDTALWERLNRAVADDMVAARRPAEAVTQLVDADLHEAGADLLLRYADTFAAEGRWGAVRGWMDKLPPRVVKERPRLLTLQGRALVASSPAMALSLFDQAVETCLGSGDVVGAADALGHRASRLVVSGRNTEAAEDCARVRGLLRGRDHPILAIAARVEGAIAARAGDFPTAFEHLAEALDRAQRLRDTALTATVERVIGWVHTATGDLGAGTAHYERAAEAWREVGDLRSLAEALISLGHVYAEQGAVAAARAKFGDALELAERLGDMRAAGFALDNLGVLARDSGDVETAIQLLERASTLARQADDIELLAVSLGQLARCRRVAGGEPGEVEALARRAIAEAERGDNPTLAARAAATLASALLVQGRTTEALITARGAAEQLGKTGQHADRARALLVAAVAARALDEAGWLRDLEEAVEAIQSTRNRAFLRAELAVLGGALDGLAASTDARRCVDAIKAAVPVGHTTTVPPRAGEATTQGRGPHVRARLLGRPEILVDGAPPDDPARRWTRRAPRYLFYILEQHRSGVPAESLIERLWPDAEPGQGQSLLWDNVARLRLALRGDQRRGRRDGVIQDGGIYRLDPDLVIETDVAAFEAAASRALNAPAGSREEAERLAEADALYTGPYLQDVEAPWALRRRRDLARLHVRILRRRIERALEDGATQLAVDLAERLVRLMPTSASAAESLATALDCAGESERAARVRRSFARRAAQHAEALGSHVRTVSKLPAVRA